ncbi:hypothetical protein SEVIR_1G172100v4 [Setaria viridis]|uniref:Uncharacterized protein n=2 Tax=Setaria TaxID=4554 RepID=K3YVR9_SETIT|nr:uncharacterized protein LOC101777062 [Setaria italica]XP_034602144.1 uncharacterized protein LOC117862744 [Setaria viridis]RCV06518.1 hypothetical protein SETIT_1G169400v2 [Setaria italica]TKW39331.1 hypothetical protein SEVIR_1G172100v2 [Setaria viridis]
MDLPNGRDDAPIPNGGVGAEETVGRRKKVELVREAIHGLLEEKRMDGQGEKEMPARQRQEDEHLLSSLLTKPDALERDPDSDTLETHSLHPSHQPGRSETSKEVELADIAKDLNKIKRQNTVTHILLGAVIVLTAVWQVNEVSFLLWVQRKLSNPFKSLGDMIKGSLKLKGRKPVIESSPLPPVGVPDVSRPDLPSFVIGSTEGR